MRWTISRQSTSGLLWIFCCTLSLSAALCQSQPDPLGAFENHVDIGATLHPGSATFDTDTSSYTIRGSGDSVGGSSDGFHFLWKKASGDISLTSGVTFPTNTGNPQKEAVLMIRQSLDPDSAYVAAIWRVVGLTAMQSRQEKGGPSQEISIQGDSAVQVRLEKRGTHFYLYMARKGEKMRPVSAASKLELAEPFYIGLGVCAYGKDLLESAVFSKVALATPSKKNLKLYSTLETISVSSADRRVVAVLAGRVQTPSFTLDGSTLLFKLGNKLEQIPVVGGKVEPAKSTATSATSKTNDKRSPDEQHQANLSYSGGKPMDTTLSVKTVADGDTKVLAAFLGEGGTLSNSPWSPDSKLLVFVSYQMVPKE